MEKNTGDSGRGGEARERYSEPESCSGSFQKSMQVLANKTTFDHDLREVGHRDAHQGDWTKVGFCSE